MLQEISPFLDMLNWKPRCRFCWNFSYPLSFTQNKPIKFQILTFSLTQRKFTNLFLFNYFWGQGGGSWIGNHYSHCAETFHSNSVSGSLIAVSVFCPSNLSFIQSKPINFEILTFSPAQTKFTHILGGWIGNHHSDCAETFHIPSVSQ